MDCIKDGWFHEKGSLWPGQAMSLEVEEVLFQGKSDFQDLIVFQSKTYGKVLILDGVIQITERDQHAYQEMITHLPMMAHPNPENVLIIGGGDGGVVTQVLKHSQVKRVTLCEIDGMVIEVSKKYFPAFENGWKDPRLEICVQDGNEFLKEKNSEYDVIIVDSSDPVGPAEVLFKKPFFEKLKQALRPDGFICTQAECFWLDLNIITPLFKFTRELFKHVDYAYTIIPTYPCGTIGFLLLSDARSAKEPLRTVDTGFTDKGESLQYYSQGIHRASFVLPLFVQRAIDSL